MELLEYWQIIRRRWWIPATLALLVGILSLLLQFLQNSLANEQPVPQPTVVETDTSIDIDIEYKASMRIIIGVLPAQDVADGQNLTYDPLYYAWLTSEYLVDDFTAVVQSRLFADNVSQRLSDANIEVPSDLIQGSATAQKQHRIVTLSLTWPDEDELVQIAEAINNEVVENATDYFYQLATTNVRISVLDSPPVIDIVEPEEEEPEEPIEEVIEIAPEPQLNSIVSVVLRMMLAFMVGIGIIFFLEYIDMSVRDRRQLEEMGFPILGEIPQA
ncbi:MAG: hypothetical protein AAF639_29820 [Chloroflexota bacterium]